MRMRPASFYTNMEGKILKSKGGGERMEADSAKPRINGSMLTSKIGQCVCVVGKNLGVSEITVEV